ncbi:MAG TPA: hypothetical protein VKR55_00820 [Bradyrhizobium sp.]|uniref:hypothetical protein n=1 Tax=Bradyrhizobium sp. TaxID=376 RepID=UPI002C8D6A7F|nr:hypothetical protein [Bradyrhizobium sp.]HLZ00671.1 hypothetical protein [Bradyrhizobium sp.]
MANQAFALSPISARASLPSEEDYEAIRDAFMETARGRWFLDEYAKRNRNADTRMVLDAVARIEETLAAQKQPPPPVVVDRLPAALTSIRGAVERAQGAASNALDGLRLEENLAPIRKGSRIIKEISWRWREIGADGRICDLIDSQVAAIDTACAQLAATDPRVALRAAFEIIRSEIEAFRNSSEAEAAPVQVAAPEQTAALVQAARPTPPIALASAPVAVDLAAAPAEADDELSPSEVETAFNEPDLPVETTAAEEELPELTQDDAEDEAVLELVAAEMAAPDPDHTDDFPDVVAESEPAHVTTPPIVEPITSFVRELEEVTPVSTQAPSPHGGPPVPARAPALQPTLSATPPVAPEPEATPSLGSTLIASGILRKPYSPASDPLAPIRRMSQAEKIAFFS